MNYEVARDHLTNLRGNAGAEHATTRTGSESNERILASVTSDVTHYVTSVSSEFEREARNSEKTFPPRGKSSDRGELSLSLSLSPSHLRSSSSRVYAFFGDTYSQFRRRRSR